MSEKKLMVMLHGYGSNGNDLESLVPFFKEILPDTHFYSPDGIEPSEAAPYGFQWFSLFDRSYEAISRELADKAELARKMILDKAAELGVLEKNIILLGFSQGTMLSMYLALSSKVPYKALIGYSGRLFIPKDVNNKSTPICLIHGKMDDVVPFECLAEAKDGLGELGAPLKTLAIDNLSHSIDMEGLNFAVNFIKELE